MISKVKPFNTHKTGIVVHCQNYLMSFRSLRQRRIVDVIFVWDCMWDSIIQTFTISNGASNSAQRLKEYATLNQYLVRRTLKETIFNLQQFQFCFCTCFREVCGFFFPMAVSQTGMLVWIGHQNFTTALTTCPEGEDAVNCCWHQTMQTEASL